MNYRKVYSQSFHFPHDPVHLARLFKDEPNLFFLDSSLIHRSRGRYAIIGFSPYKIINSDDNLDINVLSNELRKYEDAGKYKKLPMVGGAVGYFSYDFGLTLENIKLKKKKEAETPDFYFGLYDCILTVDRYHQILTITSTGCAEDGFTESKVRARHQIDYVVSKFNKFSFPQDIQLESAVENLIDDSQLQFISEYNKEEYLSIVKKALEYIAQGDIYQVNLSQKMSYRPDFEFDSFEIYELLRKLSPSQFSGFMNIGKFQIISSSPERFLQLKKGMIETRPMKGTRPRGETEEMDALMRREIKKSAKDIAELLMITDLERNDLGRVCEFGSVKVRKMRDIEQYKTVYQATSTVQGKLKNGMSGFDALKAMFPSGSITGCPKIRSMQIIEELEKSRRGIYTGALGYINFNGDMDFNILIRSLLVKNKEIEFRVGGGIVADSDPEGEYQETLVKAKAIMTTLKKIFSRKKTTAMK